ncbi:DNA-binding NarL/FixJ family response regulator [Nocardioides luteus]|uniref:DNA-binding response regulator n=1 Tax=Nocardioides luteus TaxID=1844 RepID=A0ABQ5T2Z7_9ACTN|nr:response regulator transcription factor [Nocardioides luteus]MDR7311447.1 DNA-binding NarL/FixJ family response regulator [Nocardioides luteus]GGR55535.1 DNA-binding response regulator [Nocardioides luteus]GLJ70097.1 DNA-binding response regulator [Nocardioides luteus]
MIRVLLADDHAAIRAGLRMLLATAGDIEVVGEAADGAAAVANARALRPDVVLMDVRMPGTDGVTATRQVVAEGLADVLVLTTFDLDEYVFGALRAGAAGFLLKSAEADALVDAVRHVAAGDGVVAPEVTRRVLTALASGPERHENRPGTGLPPDLTPREIDVLTALGQGLSNADIADRLVISEATTKTHVSRVLAKLDVKSRVQAAIVARESGLV